jgi:hypothetical protein
VERGKKLLIKIITIHSIHNFGSIFQATALQRFLMDKCYDTEIIDYRPRYFQSGRNKIKTFVGKLLNYGSFIRRKKKFENFISKNMVLSNKQYTKLEELKSIDGTADVFIAGGDQLWNDYHFSGRDPAFKLSFISKSNKIAFGTSMGRDNYNIEEIKSLMLAVQDFDFIGLREKSSVNYLKVSGLEQVAHVVDPVLLLDKSYYESIAIEPKMEKYALLYLVDSSSLLDATVNYIKKNIDLKIVHVCGFKKKCKCDYFLKDSGPEEILGLLINADFVISASFHATLFSVLFNKNFVSLLPNQNTNARITEWLEFVELDHRIIKNKRDLGVISEPIDFEKANYKMVNFREESKKVLIKNLQRLNFQKESG